MLRLILAAVAVVLCSGIAARATSYEPVTFDQLIAGADVIFIGQVVDVRPFALQSPAGTVIKTRVTFRVDDALWGTSSVVELFEFLGGEFDGIGMNVAEMPTFAVGDRRVVFARRERSINPIVGFSQGLLRVVRDAGGVERVFTAEGTPLAVVESIGVAHPALAASRATPMRLSDLRSRVSRALLEGRTR